MWTVTRCWRGGSLMWSVTSQIKMEGEFIVTATWFAGIMGKICIVYIDSEL